MSDISQQLQMLRSEFLDKINQIEANNKFYSRQDAMAFIDQHHPSTIVADSDTKSVDVPVRKTLERNKDEGTHRGEFQLRNVGDTDLFPISTIGVLTFNKDSSNAGDVEWVDIIDLKLPYSNKFIIDNSSAFPSVMFTPGWVHYGASSRTQPSGYNTPTTIDSTHFLFGIKIDKSSLVPTSTWFSSSVIADFDDTTDEIRRLYYEFELKDILGADFEVIGQEAKIKKVYAIGDWKLEDISTTINLPFTNFPSFDNTADPPTVTFSAGKVTWGTNSAATVQDAGPTEVIDQYFYGINVVFSIGGIVATWVSNASEDYFLDGPENIMQCYYQLQVVDGKASIKQVMATGNWRIPAVFNVESPTL